MYDFIVEHGLVVIFRGVESEKIPDCVRALYDGGARIVEITFDPSDKDTIKNTTAIIEKIHEIMGDKMVVGVGTVTCKKYAKAAYKAGARFICAPNTDTKIIKYTKKHGMISMPGAFTPSEIVTAYKAGADIVKMFPITKDDIGYLVNITRPLSHIPFLCTGGVNPDTIECFIKAGAKSLGTGISILKPELIESGNFEEISRLTALHLEKIKEARENQ